MHSHEDPRIVVVALAAAGAIAGFAQLLLSDDKLTLRLALGRASSTAILSMSALILPVWIGHLDRWQLVGAGCLIGSLGTSVIEIMIRKRLGLL